MVRAGEEGARRVSPPLARKDCDHVVGNGGPDAGVSYEASRKRRRQIAAAPESERASLRRARIDLNEMSGAIGVAHEIHAVNSG